MENNQNMNGIITEGGTSRKRRNIILIAAVVICLSFIVTGTMAFFTAEETAYNVITTGELSMDLIEETTDGKPWPEKGISGVMPGADVDKVPYVVNDGGVDFYTRIALSMKMTGEDGGELSMEYISLDINTKDWTEKDGYYYYKAAVKPGEKTEPLFTKVSFDKEMPNAYMNAKLEIDVHAEAVQSKNNGDGPLTASGWVSGN